MSVHKSLVVRSQLARARNVWTRWERITKLEEDGRFSAGQSIFGLPKVKTRIKVKTAKVLRQEAEKPAEETATPES